MAKLHFTKVLIEAIDPTDRNQTFTDDKSRGLTLIVTPNGAKTFYLTRKFKGKVERSRLGRFPDYSLQRARHRAGQVNALYDDGINPEEEKRRKRSELSLDAFFEVYDAEHCQLHNKRPEYARYTYEQYIAPSLGRKKLSEIRREEVAVLHRDLGRSGRKRTANKAQGQLRAILNKAIAWDYLRGHNPAQHIQRFREQSRDRFMSAAEVDRFHEALAEEGSTIRDFFLMLLYTGARKSELLCMAWADVDLDTEVWRIPDTKNHEPRRVVLAGPAMALLRRRHDEKASVNPSGRWVYPGRVHGRPLIDPKRAWERILDRAAIENLRIHDLRRTHASWMLEGGANLLVIGKALGHRDLASTQVYARLDLDPVRKAVESTARRLAPKPHLVKNQTAKD